MEPKEPRKWSPRRAAVARRLAGLTYQGLRNRLSKALGDEAPSISTLHDWDHNGQAPRVYWPALARALGVKVDDLTTNGGAPPKT